MTPVHAILIVIIRLWAAGMIIWTIPTLVEIPFYLSDTSGRIVDFELRRFLFAGVLAVSGVFIWVFSNTLAQHVYSARSGDRVDINVSAETLIAIGSFLIGVYYLAQYGPQLIVRLLTTIIVYTRKTAINEYQPFGPVQIPVSWEQIALEFAIVLTALTLFLKPAYLARIFNWLRNAGQYEEKSQTPAHSRELTDGNRQRNPVEE